MKFTDLLTSMFRIGTLLNVPIYLDFTFLGGLSLFSTTLSTLYAGQRYERLLLGLLSVVLLYSFVLLHEFGHLLTARRFGIGAERVTLFIFGGMASLKGLGKSPSQAALIALAGPIVSAVLALGASLLLLTGKSWTGNAVTLLNLIKTVNTTLVVFNLLPVLPLDGGRVTVALIWKIRYRLFERGYYYAVQFAARFISTPSIIGIIVVWMVFKGFDPFYAILALMIGLSLRAEYRNAEERLFYDRKPLTEVMTPLVKSDLESIDYLQTLQVPFKTHFALLPVEGRLMLLLIANGEPGKLTPEQSLPSAVQVFETKRTETVDSSISVGEYLTLSQQAPPALLHVVTQGDQWIGVVHWESIMESADRFQRGFADAETDLPEVLIK